ncbi:MAG: hypothetical protein ACJAV7_002624, partial [Flavobacteriales bacterium]
MLYQPNCTLAEAQAPVWNLRSIITVAQGEGLKLIS